MGEKLFKIKVLDATFRDVETDEVIATWDNCKTVCLEKTVVFVDKEK